MTVEEIKLIIVRTLNEKEREKRQPLPLFAELLIEELASPEDEEID
jgi:hypothetical protein